VKRKKLRRVPKDKKTGIAKKYLSGSKNRAAKAAEIKRTAAQNVTTKKKKKTTKRSRKKSS